MLACCWFVDHFIILSLCQIYQCFPSERRQNGMIDSALLLPSIEKSLLWNWFDCGGERHSTKMNLNYFWLSNRDCVNFCVLNWIELTSLSNFRRQVELLNLYALMCMCVLQLPPNCMTNKCSYFKCDKNWSSIFYGRLSLAPQIAIVYTPTLCRSDNKMWRLQRQRRRRRRPTKAFGIFALDIHSLFISFGWFLVHYPNALMNCIVFSLAKCVLIQQQYHWLGTLVQ